MSFIWTQGKIVKELIVVFAVATVFFGCATTDPNELVQMDPVQKKAELYYDYGTNALVEKNYTKALVNLKKAIAIVDEDSRFHNNLGMAYYFKKDLKKAIEHLQRSIEIDQKNSDAKNNLASIYFYQGKYQEAETLYLEVTKDLEYPKQFRVYYNLGLLDLKNNRKNKAISLFKKAIAENKSYCPAHYQMGLVSFSSHNYHQAATSFENASFGTCAADPLPYYHHALSLVNLGEFGKALIKFEEILEKFPQSKQAILATRQIKSIKINKLRGNQEQALQYQLNQIEKKMNKNRQKEKNDQPSESLNF
ncbi:MAG: tetratricopeptide repeat protein [Bacteriovoracaceae bacterium]|nr:tetratricopeptide repeat protein [Bacteriovoracaceae bacterium]